MKTLIVYHQVKPGIDCADGVAAAWAAKKKYPEADLIGASYGGAIPNIAEYDHDGLSVIHYDRVVIVDFSFTLDILTSWERCGIEVTVIDHHKTAMTDLSQFANAVFDMNESGATLTWKTFFPARPVPAFLEYVKDRDLWNFALPDSEEIHEAMSFVGRKFYQMDFLENLSQGELRSLFSPLGTKLLEPKRKRVAELAATAQPARIYGHIAMLVEIPDSESRLASDVCALIYKANPDKAFAVAQSWKKLDEVWALSFRSDKNGNDFDVSEIAKLFNGGGHKNASGGRSEEKLLALS